MSRASLNENAKHCRDLVRKGDPDRLLLADLAPVERRPALWALAAFNWEVARIPEVVSEPMLGAIRRQWWREAWGEIAGGTPRRHPVVEALADAHRATPFDLAMIEALLEARDAEHDGPPADMPALIYQAERTGGAIARLEACALGQDDWREAALHVGTAWAIIGGLRALPHSLRHGRHQLPDVVLSANGVRMDRLNPNSLPAGFCKSVDQIAQAAEVRLAATGRLPPLFRGYRRLALMYRERLRRAGWNPFDAAVNAPTVGRAWRVLRVRVGL